MQLTPNKYSYVARVRTKYLITSWAAATFDRHEALQPAEPSQLFPPRKAKCDLEKRPRRTECASLLFEHWQL